MAPAKTGNAKSKSTAVINTDHTNSGMFSIIIEDVRILMIVEIKFVAPRIDDTPAKCREKIVKSTAGPLCAKL